MDIESIQIAAIADAVVKGTVVLVIWLIWRGLTSPFRKKK